MAMAIRASVTVSMAAETRGMRRLIERVSREVVSTSLGITSSQAGEQQDVVVGQADLGKRRWDRGRSVAH